MRFRSPNRMAHFVLETHEGDVEPAPLTVFLRRLPGGPTLVVMDTAALIWLLAADGENVPDEVAAAVGVPVGDVQEDVLAYLDILVSQGLLEAVEQGRESQGWSS